jgi:TPR repeat protein
MTDIGVLYMNGQGVSQDYAEAMRWLRGAADRGVPDAQYDIGLLLRKRSWRTEVEGPGCKLVSRCCDDRVTALQDALRRPNENS